MKKTILCLAAVAAANWGSLLSAEELVTLGMDDLTSGIPGTGELTLQQAREWLAVPANHEALDVKLPLGLSAGERDMRGIKANPLTRAKIELGRQLYFDTRLSADNTVSCASCHHPQEGFGRHTQFGVGIEGLKGGRNSPVSYNRILSDAQFWDGRAGSLEAQAVGPIASPIEMGNTHDGAVSTLKQIPVYVAEFRAVFPKSGVTIDNVGKAIASFERTIVTGATPFDYRDALKPFTSLEDEDLKDLREDDPETWHKYLNLQKGARNNPMSESAVRGEALFFSKEIGCSNCHVGANLSDEKYHNLGIGMDSSMPDLGRFAETKDEKDKGAFKTPTIRNVALSAPYMHDGSLKTLEEVVEHYVKGGTKNRWLSEKMKPLKITKQQKNDLVAFMRSVTGRYPKIASGRLPE
ncbi:MAG: c-type cytochrome [Fuerstiella sp.]|nr:c-type cytochrome [Fuerstiella sp.]